MDVFGLGGRDNGEVEESEGTVGVAAHNIEAVSDNVFEEVKSLKRLDIDRRSSTLLNHIVV